MTAAALISLVAANVSAGGNGADAQVPMGSGLTGDILSLVVTLGIVATIIGIVFCIYRILRGPCLTDRVLAADVLSLQVIALVILLTISIGSEVFFDVVLVVAIIGFASTVAFAQYIGARADAGGIEELNS